MKLKLKFEDKWDKTISEQDRRLIQSIHDQIKDTTTEQLSFHTIRTTKNYKNDLLVTVLIGNTTAESFVFKNKKLAYTEEKEWVAWDVFSIPQLIVPGYTTTPWTFIFPATQLLKSPSFKEGQLILSQCNR